MKDEGCGDQEESKRIKTNLKGTNWLIKHRIIKGGCENEDDSDDDPWEYCPEDDGDMEYE